MRGQIIWDCELAQPVEEEAEDAEPLPSAPDSNDEEGEKEGEAAEGKGEGEEAGEGEGEGDGEGEGEEGEEDGFDDEENSMIELYFQPKYQTANRSFYIRCVLEVLQAILHDEMYKQLRSID